MPPKPTRSAVSRPSAHALGRRSPITAAVAIALVGLMVAPAALAGSPASPSDADVARAVSVAFEQGPDSAPRFAENFFPAREFSAWHSARWRRAPAAGVAQPVAAATPLAIDVPASPRDPSAWITEEFQADWGLEVINAHHAYARGLTGAGTRLALLDTGAGFDHPEFAGKDHRGLIMADLLADGTRCSDSTVLYGPDACFYSEGDQVAIGGQYWDPILAEYFPHPDNDYLWGNTFFGYNNHGTHVAGTMAANRDGSGMHGVAFGANLSSARLFNDSLLIIDDWCYFLDDCLVFGTGTGDGAFAYMYEQAVAQGVQAMNHSWGYTYEAYTPEEVDLFHGWLMSNPFIAAELEAMADASLSSGMIQVVAAGNSSFHANPEDAPHSAAPATLPMIFPELEQFWVSVVNLNDELELSNQSMKCGVAAQWCIAAPGTGITSTIYTGDEDIVGDWIIDDDGNLRYEFGDFQAQFGYDDYTGTSMAAPHVTGALGLLFERFPYLTGAQVRDVMLTTATDLGAEGVDEIYGWGLLDLKKAIEGPGLLRVDTEVVMNQAAGGHKVWQGGAWDDWTNDIGGPGHLTKAGAGWLRLSGDNSFAGATVRSGILELDGTNALAGNVHVAGGAFLLNGSLAGSDLEVAGGLAVVNGTVVGGSTRVAAGGRLGGSGTLSDTHVAGTIAPGNSIGTLTVDGDYTQVAGSVFEAELLPPDGSDLLHVTGTANIEGGTLHAIGLPGTFLVGHDYRIITADGGLSGGFDTFQSSNVSPFLELLLRYTGNGLYIDVARGAALASAAGTRNQLATASVVDLLPDDHEILVSVTQLDPATAMQALDLLSGDVHASTRAILLDSGRMARNAALARAAHGQDAFTAQQDAGAVTGAWVEAHRQGGRIAGDGNAAGVQSSSSSILVGIDHGFGGWRVGVFGGTGSTDLDVRQRSSRVGADSRHAGIHVSNAWGGFGVRAGYTYTWHEIDSERRVEFPGFADFASARYDANAWQAFVEAGRRFETGAWSFEPYVQYAHVELDADGFTEDGGAAALAVQSGDARVDLATAGVRFDVALRGSGQAQSWLALRGNVGYRHAGGDQAQAVRAGWSSFDAFTVRSPLVTDEATVVDLGFAARTSANSLVEVGYSGLLSDGIRDHGANVRFSLQF